MRALVVLVMVASAEVLASQCASPAPFVLPRTTIEEGGLLYVFLPTNYRREPEQESLAKWQQQALGEFWVETTGGKALPFELKLVARGDVFDVFSLKVEAKVGTEFIGKPVQSHYAVTVVKSVKTTQPKLEVTLGKDDNYKDSLSSQQVRTLVPSFEAPAFRVTWRGGVVVLPGRIMYGSHAEPGLQLGSLYCTGTSVWWATPTEFTVTALLSDGREVSAAPVTLEPPPSHESLPHRKLRR